MTREELLALRVPAQALGLDAAAHAQVIAYAVTQAQAATAGVSDSEQREQATQAHALATLLRLELEYTRRAYSSGTGPDGSFGYSELSARMAEIKAELARQEAAFLTIVPAEQPAAPAGPSRASGSVPINFDA